MTTVTTCDTIIYPHGRYGSFRGAPCGRPVKEGSKCGVHCESAVEKRNKKFKLEMDKRAADELTRKTTVSIGFLKGLGYKIIHPTGETL